MNTDDDRMCAALRAVADEPAPPATTTLDQVLTKGRRRVFVQRGATVAAVVGVVATIGIGGVLLRSATEGQGTRPAGPPAPTSTTTTTTVVVTTTPPPPSTDTGVPTLLPGWHRVAVPADRVDGKQCVGGAYAGPGPDLALPPQELITERFLDAVRKVAADPTITESRWDPPAPKTTVPSGFLDASVHSDSGPGNVQLEVGHYGGAPEAAADSEVGSFGNCDPPARTTLADGTVLQLEQPDHGDPTIPVQRLHVFQPNGRLYTVTSVGYAKTNGPGTLPLDDAAIADVATALAALGR